MSQYFKGLNKDKIKINGNKNPILMELFLSFLTVETKRGQHFLGSSTGWTQLTGDNGLVITGGIVTGTEYLDHILYGKNIDNPYNNFVNPFYLFGIFNDTGKKFFLNYYSDEIDAQLKSAHDLVGTKKAQLEKAEIDEQRTSDFWETLRKENYFER